MQKKILGVPICIMAHRHNLPPIWWKPTLIQLVLERRMWVGERRKGGRRTPLKRKRGSGCGGGPLVGELVKNTAGRPAQLRERKRLKALRQTQYHLE